MRKNSNLTQTPGNRSRRQIMEENETSNTNPESVRVGNPDPKTRKASFAAEHIARRRPEEANYKQLKSTVARDH